MKTAAELNTIGERIYWAVEYGRAGEVISELKAVQLDAMKEGMRRAAKICNDQWKQMEVPAERLQIYYAEKGILTAAEQLTEKDL